ncbi:MAG: hypothetical protein WDZ40_00320 [Candidatus Spechtbacterales bacterium]
MQTGIEAVKLGAPPYGILEGARPTQYKWFSDLSRDSLEALLEKTSGDIVHNLGRDNVARKEEK